MAKELITSTWKKISSKRGTVITYLTGVYITTSIDTPEQNIIGEFIKPQTSRSFYVTNETESIWIRADVSCDVEVVNFI